MIKKVKKELDDVVKAREKAIGIQREVVPLCAQAIRDVQKHKYSQAEKKTKLIRKKLDNAEKVLKKFPGVADSVLSGGYQEYAELKIVLTYIKLKRLPKRDVPAKYYLLGLGDAIGELKRIGVDLLAQDRLKDAEKLYDKLEDLYSVFSSRVYPNAVVPGLKRKQDVMRKVLNDFHNLIVNRKISKR